MNLRDVRLAKKLGNDFFEFQDELKEEQKKFRDFKDESTSRILKIKEIGQLDKAVTDFNKEILSFWINTFRFKSYYYVTSGICNSIATEKLEASVAKSISLKLAIDNSIEDVLTLVSCLSHYEVLFELYCAIHLNSLGPNVMKKVKAYGDEKNIQDIDLRLIKSYLGAEVVSSLNVKAITQLYGLTEQAWQFATKNSIGPYKDEDFVKYNLVLAQALVKRGNETSEEYSQDLSDFIKESFNPVPKRC